ncbi:hypothetical protein OROMI_016053 [Orobanche minor]
MEPSFIGSVNKISGVHLPVLSLSPTSSLSISLIRRRASDWRHLTATNRLSGLVIFTYSCFSQLVRSLSLSTKSFRSEASISSSELHNSDESTTISSRKIGSGRKMAPTKIYVIHGGEWCDDNKYEGGRRELIPIPPGGISLKDLVAKIEMRLMKPRDGYVYEIDALINDDESIEGDSTDELLRTKITDDFELSFTMRSLDKDPVADNSRLDKYPMASKTIPSFVNDHFNDDDDPNFHVDDFHHEDFQDEYLDDDDVGTQEEDRCGSNRHNVSLLQTTQDSVQGSSNVGRQWTIQGASFHRLAPSENLETAIVEVADCTVDKIAKDVIFNNKASMIASVGLYHLLQHLEFETKKSSSQRYVLVCKHNKDVRPFILRAKSLGKAWVVDVWCTHTCEKDLRYHADPTVLSKVLASYFDPNLMVEGVVLQPRDIQAQLNQALTMTYGDSSESFQKLPGYFYMLEQSNPGSVVDLQIDEAGAFEYCFMSLAASIRGFKACRPVIVVDGTHLKGKYNGIMFVAATKDANEQIFPLAFGFGAKECDKSWIWFLEQCRRTFGSPENLLIVSDQHVSIKNALDVVYPGTPHGICTYHLQGKSRWWGDHAIIMFQAAANAYRCRDFEDRMANLKGFAPGAHDKLIAVDPVRWARSMCPVRRYNFLTSNCAECLNGRLRWARKLPVCTLLECVRLMIGQWFAERRAEAMKRTQELTAFAEARLARAAELSHKYSIEEISPTKYKPYVPQTKQSAVAYVAGYFTTQALREIYAGEVMPTPIPDEWCVPVEVSSRIVITPANTRQAGRPRQNRMSAGSGSRTSGTNFVGGVFREVITRTHARSIWI